MLTKDLIRYRIKDNNIFPTLIDTGNKNYQEMASALLQVFRESAGKQRVELDEESQAVCEAFPTRLLVARGLRKLLMDRTDFQQPVNEDFIDFRADIFARSAAFWKTATAASSLEDLNKKMPQNAEDASAGIRENLYGDLSEFQRVERFRKFTVQQLLDRYNIAQAQGLIITSHSLTAEIHAPEIESVRQLVKHLRFRQLLAEISQQEDSRLILRVDGPMNLFFQTQKYGLNLALFFPALLHHAQWKISAVVQPKRQKTYQLTLDQDSRLKPYSHHFSSYVPEEVKQFQTAFVDKVSEWRISPGSRFLDIRGENYCFPDYQLQHDAGAELALELFHSWHKTHLLKRLKDLITTDSPLLIIGVSRNLLKNKEIEAALQSSDYFQKWGFLFRDIPSVGKLSKILDRYLGSLE